jgi:hypothetical protein
MLVQSTPKRKAVQGSRENAARGSREAGLRRGSPGSRRRSATWQDSPVQRSVPPAALLAAIPPSSIFVEATPFARGDATMRADLARV